MYYKLITRYYNDGSTSHNIKAEEVKGKNRCIETALCDIYYDYFDTQKEAETAHKESRLA
jgi:hypothetical protein